MASGRLGFFLAMSAKGDLAWYDNSAGERIMVQRPGGPAQRLVDLTAVTRVRGLLWSPDGRRLTLSGTVAGRGYAFLVDVASARVTRLETPGVDVALTAFSADGASLILVGDAGDGSRVWRRSLAAADAAHPVSGSGWAQALPGPQGEIYVVRRAQPGIWVIGPDRRARLILDAPFPPNAYPYWTWTVGHGRIYVLYGRALSERRIISWPVDGGPPLTIPVPDAVAFAVDPRSGELALMRRRSVDSDIGVFHVRRE